MNNFKGNSPLDTLLLNSFRLRKLIDELNERGRNAIKSQKAA